MENQNRVEEILRKREKSAGAKYEKMERFDGKITSDQFDYLKKTARQIMKTRNGEKIERITANSILRTGDQVKAQSAKIQTQTEEIKALRAAIIELRAGIETIREEVTRPTPGPAAGVTTGPGE